jgi:hypothetical protein
MLSAFDKNPPECGQFLSSVTTIGHVRPLNVTQVQKL